MSSVGDICFDSYRGFARGLWVFFPPAPSTYVSMGAQGAVAVLCVERVPGGGRGGGVNFVSEQPAVHEACYDRGSSPLFVLKLPLNLGA